MRTKELQIFVYEYNNISELPNEDQGLVLKAREASSKAYAPYSNFRVGAAILLENGEVVLGNNQENAAFPSGLCAERVAMFYANANFPDVPIKAIAVTASNTKGLLDEPASPCGACRQALAESEIRFKNKIRVILDGTKKVQVLQGIEMLLPFVFKPESMK